MAFGTFVHGGVTYPLPATAGDGSHNSALLDADPSLYYVIDYFTFVLQAYMGARLVAEAAAGGIANPAITQAVQYVLPYDPLPYLKEQQISKFPLLCVWRESDKDKWETVGHMQTAARWKVAYILPPITGGQFERIGPLLNSVGKILLNRIENMMDPGYRGGAEVWKLAGLEEIYLDSAVWGSFDLEKAGTNLSFPAWVGTLVVTERDEALPDGATDGKFTGADVSITDASSGAPVAMVDLVANVADPSTITGFQALYRADTGITLNATGDRITRIADQSTHAFDEIAPLAANDPYALRDGSTERDIARFDGIATYLTTTIAALAADTAKTLVVAFRLWDTSARSSVLLATDTTANGTVAIEANTLSSSGGKLGLLAGGSSFDTQFPADMTWHIAVLRITASTPGSGIAASVKLMIDDLPAVLTLKSGAGNWSSLAGANQLAIGGLSSNLSATAARVDIGVAMAFTANLSDADAATAAAYCKQWLASQN